MQATSVDLRSRILGLDARQRTDNIRYYDPQWQNIAGMLTCLSVGSDGSVWGVNAMQSAEPRNRTNSNVFRWGSLIEWDGVPPSTWANVLPPDAHGHWPYPDGPYGPLPPYGHHLTQISVSSEHDGIWGVDATLAPDRDNVYKWTGWYTKSTDQFGRWKELACNSWWLQPGHMTSVVVQKSRIWGINTTIEPPAHNVFAWSGANEPWAPVGSNRYLTDLAVGPNASLWGVDSTQPKDRANVFRWNGQTWDPVPGRLTGIAVAQDGSVLGVNAELPTSRSNLFCWDSTGQKWNEMLGWFVQIAAGSMLPGSMQVWGINSARPTTESNLWRLTLPLRSASGFLTCLSADINGGLWGVDATQPASEDNVYHWGAGGWKPIKGRHLTQIAAGSGISIWGVDTTLARPNNVFRWTGSRWESVGGWMTSVALNYNGEAWGVDTTLARPDNVFRWTGSGWESVGGWMTSVAVTADGTVWGVDSATPPSGDRSVGNIYSRRTGDKGWTPVDGYLTDIGVDHDGVVWGVNANLASGQNNVFRWSSTGWVPMPGYLTQIAPGAGDLLPWVRR
jgi:hypothetical protein